MRVNAVRLIALSGAMISLALMVFMAQPWGDNYAYRDLSGYALLLGFAVWALLPYLMILFLAGKGLASRATASFVVAGAFFISFGGVFLYADAALLHPDPQGGLVFLLVPCYQWLSLGLLTGLQVLFRKKPSA